MHLLRGSKSTLEMQKAQIDFSIKRLALVYEITVFCSAAPQCPPNISKTKLPVINI